MSSQHHLDESAQGRVKIHRRERGERRVGREGITSTLHYTVQPSTGFQVTAGTPSLYLSPGGGEIVGTFPAVTDTPARPLVRGVTLLRASGTQDCLGLSRWPNQRE